MTQEPKKVFISYSSKDSAKAKDILARLEGAGISCWISQRDIPPGADFAEEIQNAISNCTHYVLLLTNAAQESPYVKLELDQAFKQNKEIIPIQLEQLIQNKKTNFYLNAKQSVDATKDLTAAVNTIIRRIKPEHTVEKPIADAPRKNAPAKGRDTVRCPFCNCAVLKRQRYFDDRFLYPEEGTGKTESFGRWLIKYRTTVQNTSMLLVILIGIFCLYFLATYAETTPFVAFTFLIVGAIAIAYIIIFCITLDIADTADTLAYEISDYGLKHWTFKCAGCERTFSTLIPKEGKLTDWVPGLLTSKSKNNQTSNKTE